MCLFIILSSTFKEPSIWLKFITFCLLNLLICFINWSYSSSLDLPTIIYVKPTVEVYLAQTAVLPCAAQGNPGVNFRWLFPNGGRVKTNDKYRISNNGSLVISNIGISDAKNYTCAPYSTLGEGVQKHTEVVVLCKFFCSNLFKFKKR